VVVSTTINRPYETNNLAPEFVDNEIWLSTLELNWDLGFANAFSTTSFSTKTVARSRDFGEIDSPLSSAFTGTPLPSNELTDAESKTWSQELRLASSGDGALAWLAGVFYINRTGDNSIVEGSPGYVGSGFERPGTGNIVDTVFDTESSEIAAFGEVSYRFNDQWRAALSGRAYRNEISQDDKVAWAFGPLGPGGLRETEDSGAIPRVLVEYRPSDQIMVYSLYSQGYRVGGLNIPQPGLPANFGPDTVDAYELGLKSRLFDRNITLNLALFRNEWENIQVNEVIGGLAALTNGPQALTQGLEFELAARLGNGFSLNWSGALTDAQVEEDAPGVNANRGGIRNGDSLPGVADFTSSAQLRYDHSFGDELSGYVVLDARYFGGAYNGFNTADPLVKEIPAWSQFNVRFGLDLSKYEVVAFVENLANADDISNIAFNGGFQRDGIARLRPRTIGLTLRADF
jgi:outer membrane receptor protein involved in Fe transport